MFFVSRSGCCRPESTGQPCISIKIETLPEFLGFRHADHIPDPSCMKGGCKKGILALR